MGIHNFIEETKKRDFKGQAFGQVISIIKRDPNLLEETIRKTEFLNQVYQDISLSQRFYHLWFNIMEIEKCPYCDEHKKFSFTNKFSINQYNKRDANYCGTCCKDECNKKYNLDKGREKLIEKYGTKNVWEIEGYRKKFEKNNIEKYGTKYYTSTEEFKFKTQKTFEKKYGVHPTKLESTQDKIKKTNVEKYGYSHRLKDPIKYEEYSRKSFQYKDYIFPSGKKVRIQGYENLAIDLLLKIHDEVNIIIEDSEISQETGKIEYSKDRIYFPDIFIKTENKIIEVKSEYTYECNLAENLEKKDAVLAKKINFEFWIFDAKGNLRII